MTNDWLPLLIVMLATVGCSAKATVVSIDLRTPNDVSTVGWQPQSDIDLFGLEGPIQLQLTLPSGDILTHRCNKVSLTNDGNTLTGVQIIIEGERGDAISRSTDLLSSLGFPKADINQWKQEAVASRPNLRLQKIFRFNTIKAKVSLRGSVDHSQLIVAITLPRPVPNNSD